MTFDVLAMFEVPDADYMIAGDSIHARVGIGPPSFQPGGDYFFTMTFPFSHFANETHYAPFLDGRCFLDPQVPQFPPANGNVWESLPFFGDCRIYYEIPGNFPIVLNVEKIARNDTSAWIEEVGSVRLDHYISVVPLDTQLNDRDADILERATLAALMIAVLSLGMQAFSSFREATNRLETKMDSVSEEMDDELEEELVEELTTKWMKKHESESPPARSQVK